MTSISKILVIFYYSSLQAMHKSLDIGGANISCDDLIAIHKYICINYSIISVIVCDLICIPLNIFLFEFGKVKPLTLLKLIVCCKYFIGF